MKRLIPQYGDAVLQSRGDAFVTLARSIVGQQISVKAAQTVWERFAALPRAMTPAAVLKLKIDDMRAAGLSVLMDHEGKSFKARMKQADKLGARLTLILGDSELQKGVWAVRDMARSEQSEVAEERLLDHVKEKLHG